MPVFFDKNTDDVRIGIWKISETYDELYKISNINSDEKLKLDSFKNRQRKLQFLATRALLKSLTNSSVKILYDENGSPFLSNKGKISISHSKDWAGIIISKYNVGIDIEQIDKKIKRIIPKFLSKEEQKQVSLNDLTALYLYWSAKESMVKVTNNKSFAYNKDLKIEPFKTNKSGFFNGIINQRNKKLKLEFNYEVFNNIVLVWCVMKNKINVTRINPK